ncbi:MAG: hypothetical protein IH571_04010 [Acholeplasmataceae bacterium]|nr:hypothetical protein [Acholeplasmataceae bacterium]
MNTRMPFNPMGTFLIPDDDEFHIKDIHQDECEAIFFADFQLGLKCTTGEKSVSCYYW